MNTALKLLLPLLVALVVFSGEARACTCAGGAPPCQSYWQASAVFVGQVVGVSTVGAEEGAGESKYKYKRRSFRFAVERALRGVRGTSVEVLTGQGGGDCGYDFERGERYVVYAHLDEKQGRLSTSICTRTRPVAGAGEDLRYFDALAQGATSGGVIYGRVLKDGRLPNDESTDRHERPPLPGAKVEAAGGGRAVRAVTDAEGKYHLRGLPPGEYTLRLDLPETLLVRDPERKVRVEEGGCAVEVFSVESNGRLGGRVFDSEGRPAAKVALRLSEAARGDEYFLGHSAHATSDADGRYEFRGVPPGRYIIRVRFDGEETEMGRPFPLLYHPNVRDPARAATLLVGEGEKIEGYDLRLPPLPAERAIEGVAVYPDGQPAAGVQIDYTADVPFVPVGYAVKADGAGRFSFKVYEGVGLKLTAGTRRADGSQVNSETVDVPATGAVDELRIVVPRP
jgi:hypothetical protein